MPVLISHSRFTQCGEHQHQPLWQRVCPWQRFSALPTGEKSPLSGDIISRPKTLIMRRRISRLEPIDLSDTIRTCYGFHMLCLCTSNIQDLFMGSICCAVVPPRFRDTANCSETHELHALYKLWTLPVEHAASLMKYNYRFDKAWRARC